MMYQPAEDRYDNMLYRRTGKSGLLLPALSLGLWHNFGGVDTVVEIGPGRVLSGLARVNGLRKNVDMFNANNLRGVEQVVQQLTQQEQPLNSPAEESSGQAA